MLSFLSSLGALGTPFIAAAVGTTVAPCLGPIYSFCNETSVSIKSVMGNPQFAAYEPALAHLYTASSTSELLEQFDPLTLKTMTLPLSKAVGSNIELVISGLALSGYHENVWVSLTSMHTSTLDLVTQFTAPFKSPGRPAFVANVTAAIEQMPGILDLELRKTTQQLAVDSFGNAYYTFTTKYHGGLNSMHVIKIDIKGHTSTLITNEWVSPRWIGNVIVDDHLVGFGLMGHAGFFVITPTTGNIVTQVYRAGNFRPDTVKLNRHLKLESMTVMPTSDGTYIAVVADQDTWLFEHDKTAGIFAYLGSVRLPVSPDARSMPSALVEICPGELHVAHWSDKNLHKSFKVDHFEKLDTFRAPRVKTPCLA